MSNALSPTQKLAEYVCIFLDKRLSEPTVHTVKVNLIQQILEYQKNTLKDFCERKNICINCAEKLDDNHDEECWDNK
jgi:hypothetical protein